MENHIDAAAAGALDAPLGTEPSGFHSAIAHLRRGEMQRMTVWRQRLDVTGNWAILLTVALTTFTLGGTRRAALCAAARSGTHRHLSTH